ncbi:conjugal transfer protein TraG N-terminal domain-containing protein [Salinisphaera orenii]|uniref:conjugal transfer protein TraG N-terminal domain-containing protein n=1 Tax=Salinisphaera orenii TaxID=856731 RepID=UPI000DBE6582
MNLPSVTNVDLPVFDFFENVVLELGWIVSNQIWAMLQSTMIAALPFLALLIREWYNARREGEDEGNKGLLALNRIEAALYAMLIVYLFAVVPLATVQFAPVNVDQQHYEQCGTRVATGGTTGAGGAALGEHTAHMPIWWAMVHAVSHGAANVAVAALPCQTDYTYMRTELRASSIDNPELRQEVARFQQWCYGRAHTKFLNNTDNITSQQASSTDWIGSDYLLQTAGYYDSFQAHRPVSNFPYKAERDDGNGTPPSDGGYPSCKRWWQADDVGLRSRLHDQIDPDLWQNFEGAFDFTASDEDYAIRALVTNGGAIGDASNDPSGYDGAGGMGPLSKTGDAAMGFAGVALAQMPAGAMKDVTIRAMPMVQYLTLMAIVIAMPFVIVFSGYSFRAVGLMSATYFGIVTITFWISLARWLENHLIEILYNSDAAQLGFMAGLSSAYDTGILGLVQVAMLVIFPSFWLSMLGWAGWTVGGGINDAVKGGSGEAKGAGKQGGQVANSAVSKGVKK